MVVPGFDLVVGCGHVAGRHVPRPGHAAEPTVADVDRVAVDAELSRRRQTATAAAAALTAGTAAATAGAPLDPNFTEFLFPNGLHFHFDSLRRRSRNG